MKARTARAELRAALGRFFKSLGDYAFARGWDWLANVCYEVARKLGADMSWPPRATRGKRSGWR